MDPLSLYLECQLNMAVFFWYLGKSDLSRLQMYSSVHWITFTRYHKNTAMFNRSSCTWDAANFSSRSFMSLCLYRNFFALHNLKGTVHEFIQTILVCLNSNSFYTFIFFFSSLYLHLLIGLFKNLSKLHIR